MYGQPMYAPQAPPYDLRPAEMPYREGQPVPAGYHAEDRVRNGPLITGIALVGSFYLLGLAAGAGDDFDNQKGWLLLPVLGPWMTLMQREDTCEIQDEFGDSCSVVFDGLVQGTGALLMGIGLAVPKTVLVRDDARTVRIAPGRVGEQGRGLTIRGTF